MGRASLVYVSAYLGSSHADEAARAEAVSRMNSRSEACPESRISLDVNAKVDLSRRGRVFETLVLRVKLKDHTKSVLRWHDLTISQDIAYLLANVRQAGSAAHDEAGCKAELKGTGTCSLLSGRATAGYRGTP